MKNLRDEQRNKITQCESKYEDLKWDNEYFKEFKPRTFGKTNPELTNNKIWLNMVKCRLTAYDFRVKFNFLSFDKPIWCCDRLGQSINVLDNGTVIEIGGEHEDFYDEDFCIYNDVIVHHKNEKKEIYSYPKEVFPCTDFHTATLVKDKIFIIGCLGYHENRIYGYTPVYQLDIKNFIISKLETTGDNPGWIFRHNAELSSNTNEIIITGGEILVGEDLTDCDCEPITSNQITYRLNLDTMVWEKDD